MYVPVCECVCVCASTIEASSLYSFHLGRIEYLSDLPTGACPHI